MFLLNVTCGMTYFKPILCVYLQYTINNFVQSLNLFSRTVFLQAAIVAMVISKPRSFLFF